MAANGDDRKGAVLQEHPRTLLKFLAGSKILQNRVKCTTSTAACELH